MFDKLLTLAGRVLRAYFRFRPRCAICGHPIERDQLTAVWRVAHLGGPVRVHRFCATPSRACELGSVVRT